MAQQMISLRKLGQFKNISYLRLLGTPTRTRNCTTTSKFGIPDFFAQDSQYIQQDDIYKEFMMSLTDGGLVYASAKYFNDPGWQHYYRQQVQPKDRRNIIVIGAGMAGLSAAYELAQIGHRVTILESQYRVGGRVKTFREGFQDGLHCEGGAMRIPPNHYLTMNYMQQFLVQLRPFINFNKNTYMYIYGDKIRMEDWIKDNKKYMDKYWKGWDETLKKNKLSANGIYDYYDRTMKPVTDTLNRCSTNKDWQNWLNKWSKMSVEQFLRSTAYQDCVDGDKLRPWPEAAIDAYKVSTYTPARNQDLATYTREKLGGWWGDQMQTPTYGMDTLPKAFIRKNDNGWNKDVNLSKNIKFGTVVEKIEKIVCPTDKPAQVKVSAYNKLSGEKQEFISEAVIVSVPLNILHQMDVPLSLQHCQALVNINYAASTKIMLQCKSRFWEQDVGSGGFSKSNMMIGQLHYPCPDTQNPDNKRGILLVYTWAQNALAFGADGADLAIKTAVHEISKIHPEIIQEFEVGQVQAWFSDPSAQGAYAQLAPYDYLNAMDTLTTPEPPIYLASEALSWSNGWIQGALFSGLTQAFCFQAYSEGRGIIRPIHMF